MMKLRNFLLGTALFVSASVANAIAFFPTDGDINFAFEGGALADATLAIFDETSDFGTSSSLEVVVPDLIYWDDVNSSLHYNADFSDLGLTIADGDFVLGACANSDDCSDSANWVAGEINFGNALTVPEVNTYAVQFTGIGGNEIIIDIAPVPVPAAVWLFGSGLLGLVGVARRRA